MPRIQLPPFPVAVGPEEMVPLYRDAKVHDLRSWVRVAFTGLIDPPLNELSGRVLAEHFATEQLGRRLYRCEARVLDEAVRDILTAATVLRQMEAQPAPELHTRLQRPWRRFA